MAMQLKNEFPYMGDYTYRTKHSGTYIDDLSYGGLVKPSELWMKQFHVLEALFLKRHGN
jgi:hypothetical protein